MCTFSELFNSDNEKQKVLVLLFSKAMRPTFRLTLFRTSAGLILSTAATSAVSSSSDLGISADLSQGEPGFPSFFNWEQQQHR